MILPEQCVWLEGPKTTCFISLQALLLEKRTETKSVWLWQAELSPGEEVAELCGLFLEVQSFGH